MPNLNEKPSTDLAFCGGCGNSGVAIGGGQPSRPEPDMCHTANSDD
jgi:hypothetical protein